MTKVNFSFDKIASAKTNWRDLSVSATALAIADSAKNFTGLTVVIAGSANEVDAYASSINFFTLGHNLPIYRLPDWETLPYDIFSPHQDIVSERLSTLSQLYSVSHGILVISVQTMMHRLIPTDFVASRTFLHRVGDICIREKFLLQLEQVGYQRTDTVFNCGEYAPRGSIIDVYPMGAKTPFRIDLIDDEIETLRLFDIDSQRTIKKVNELSILPAKEFPMDRASVNRFLNRWCLTFPNIPRETPIYRDVANGIAPQGIEYFLKLFFENMATIFDYLPPETKIFSLAGVETASKNFWENITSRYDDFQLDNQRPLLPPDEIFISVNELFQRIGALRTVSLSETADPKSNENYNFRIHNLPNISINETPKISFVALNTFLNEIDDDSLKVLFCADSAGRREILIDLLSDSGITAQVHKDWKNFTESSCKFAITVCQLERGFFWEEKNICIIAEGELFGKQVMQRRRRSKSSKIPEQIFKSLAELQQGTPVVHIEHGIGKYCGLKTLAIDNSFQEFLELSYAEDAKLYVPVASLHLISRFGASNHESVTLSRLGSDKWGKAKEKAAKQIRDTAVELLDIYSRRASKTGYACKDDVKNYDQFCREFPFEETGDQNEAIQAVRQDLLRPQPMDRLICGDVGFGKTEVAMRAAFIVVSSGKQAIILVPTTLLAHQHTENFRDRFSNWPITIESLSRFKTKTEQKKISVALESGSVDILITTHKLLHLNLQFPRLGLLVIDEEHRFGVRQKEKIKSLRSHVDILTLTATPIPRTLNMSMNKLRDLSIIATPPAKRLSIKTFVRKDDSRVIKEAIMREIMRGGQIYFLHNDVKSIENIAHNLSSLVPEALIKIAHGQMRERDLERVMSEFYHKRFNVLVCTTIIETGIDVPSANTIIINRADKFGLAQLHQLRGRVGRSHHQAYAYLMIPVDKIMDSNARKRLEAISLSDYLGSGFALATNDLEIRGAGELLGDEQSGHITSIGFTLYHEMLDNAVKAIRLGEEPSSIDVMKEVVEVNLNVPALIPDSYLPDVNMRLTLYKRIANCQTNQDLYDLQVEMIDRFGLLPEPAKMLFRMAELRQIGENLGITKIEAGPVSGRLCFSSKTPVDPIKIIELVQNNPTKFRIKSNDQLSFYFPMEEPDMRISQLKTIMDHLFVETN